MSRQPVSDRMSIWEIPSTYKFMYSQQVRLGKRILNFKDFREIIHRTVSALQGKARLILETPCGIDSDWNTLSLILALSHGLDIFKVTNGPSQKLRQDIELVMGVAWKTAFVVLT